MSEEYRLVIENTFTLAKNLNIDHLANDLIAIANGLCAAGLPLAAAIALSSIPVGRHAQAIGASVQAALQKLETGPVSSFMRAVDSEVQSRGIAQRAAAICLWVAQTHIDQGLPVDSGLRVRLDSGLQDEISAAKRASMSKFPADELTRAAIGSRRISTGEFAEPAVDTPVGWVAHVRCVAPSFSICAPGDTETAVVDYSVRDIIDPEIALGHCLSVRIYIKMVYPCSTSRTELAAQAPSTAAALAEALERRRQSMAYGSVLVFPAVII